MVGDSPEADVAGGQAAGLQTAWIRRGRVWPVDDPLPDLRVDTVAEAATRGLQRQGPALLSRLCAVAGTGASNPFCAQRPTMNSNAVACFGRRASRSPLSR